MTRLKKFLVAGLMMIVTVCAYLGSAIVTVTNSVFNFGKAHADSYKYGNTNNSDDTVKKGATLSVKALSDTVKVGGDPLTIPLKGDNVTASGSAQIFVEVKQAGNIIAGYNATSGEQEIIDDTQLAYDSDAKNALVLTPKMAGTYTVQYMAKSTDGVWTLSKVYTVNAIMDAYKMVVNANDEVVMPSTFNSSEATTLNVALPLFYDAEGELIEYSANKQSNAFILGGQQNGYYYVAKYMDLKATLGQDEYVKLSDVADLTENNNDYSEYKTYVVEKVMGNVAEATAKYILKVETNAAGAVKTNYASEGALELNVTGTGLALDTPTAVPYSKVAYKFSAASGQNYVNYKLALNDDSETVVKTQSVKVTGDNNYASDKIQLKLSYTEHTFTTAKESYKQKVYLNEVTVTNTAEADNAVNAFKYYTIKLKDSGEYVKMGKDEKGFYFVPDEVNKEYVIAVGAQDFYHSTVYGAIDNNYVVKVSDNTTPAYTLVGSYTSTDDEADIDMTDMSYQIPTKINIGATITIPAIYAYDESGIKNIYRQISSNAFIKKDTTEKVTNTAYAYINNANGYKASVSGDIEDISQYMKYVGMTFEAGTYYKNDIEANTFYVDQAGIFKDAKTGQALENTALTTAQATATFYRKAVTSGTTTTYKWFNLVNGEEGTEIDDLTTISGKAGFYINENQDFKKFNGDSVEKDKVRDAKLSKAVELTIDPALFGEGSYTLTYNITDNNGKSKSAPVKFEVASATFTDTKSPTVKFGAVNLGRIKENQIVKVAVPTVTDDVDTNLKVEYIVTCGYNTYSSLDGEVELSEDGKYILFDMGSDAGSPYLNAVSDGAKMTITAKATDDYGNTAEDSIVLTVDDGTTADLDVPETTLSTITLESKNFAGKFVQNDTVLVDGFEFTDASQYATVSAKVVDTEGKEIPVASRGVLIKTYNTIDGVWKYTFSGISFYADNANADSNYTVNYTIEDASHNTLNMAFVLFHPVDRTAPVISGFSDSEATIALGEPYFLSDITATDNATEDEDIKFNWVVTDQDGNDVGGYASWNKDSGVFEFMPQVAGTYTITLTTEDDATTPNVSTPRTITLKVENKLEAEIIVDETKTPLNDKIDEAALPKITVGTGDDAHEEPDYENITLELPTFNIVDKATNLAPDAIFGNISGQFTITTPKADKKASNGNDKPTSYTYDMQGNFLGAEGEVDYLNLRFEDSVFKFTPFARGTYTVTYSATVGDKELDNIVVTRSLGDTTGPDIHFVSSFTKLINNGFTAGDRLVIDTRSAIKDASNQNATHSYIFDASGYEYIDEEADDKLVQAEVVVKKGSSKVSEATGVENPETGKVYYDLKEAGNYTVTFTVQDKYGNKSSKSLTFTVSAKSTNAKETKSIVGTVLIIVSAVILAGVVVYFVKGTKLLPKRHKKSKEKEND